MEYWGIGWAVEYTDEFETWWNTLSVEEQVEINARVELLEEHGPTLPRPYADVITSSRHSNMKELRGKVEGTAFAGSVRIRSSAHGSASNRWR